VARPVNSWHYAGTTVLVRMQVAGAGISRGHSRICPLLAGCSSEKPGGRTTTGWGPSPAMSARTAAFRRSLDMGWDVLRKSVYMGGYRPQLPCQAALVPTLALSLWRIRPRSLFWQHTTSKEPVYAWSTGVTQGAGFFSTAVLPGPICASLMLADVGARCLRVGIGPERGADHRCGMLRRHDGLIEGRRPGHAYPQSHKDFTSGSNLERRKPRHKCVWLNRWSTQHRHRAAFALGMEP